MAKPTLSEARPGEREHRGALIDPDRARGERGDQFEHAAGAGAEVEDRVNAGVADEIEDRRLDALLRRVQRADVVPVGGAFCEVRRGLPAPRLAGDFQPGAVGLQRRIVGGDPGDEIARERAARLRQAEERPGAFALAFGEPRIDQELEMARIRGCDWPRIATSSLTVKSASHKRPSRRSRVTSRPPRARRAVRRNSGAHARGGTAMD